MNQNVDEKYDVVIVGGGAAGLGAALALARSRRSVLVVDSGNPRNAPAAHVHNFLTREGTPPGELLALGRAEVTGYGAEVVTGTVVSAEPAEPPANGFQVRLDSGQAVSARRLVIATGLVDELPDIPGLAQRFGRDVLHCPYCHGWEVRDQAIGILATSAMSVHQAMLFRQLSDDVILFRHNVTDLTLEQLEELAVQGISVVDGKVVGLEVTEDRLTGVRLASGEVVARQALAVGPRFTARTELAGPLGLVPAQFEINGHVMGTYIPADPNGATAVAGVWVAGNTVDLRAQVISSAAAGLNVAVAINGDLIAEDTRLAVEAYRARQTPGERIMAG